MAFPPHPPPNADNSVKPECESPSGEDQRKSMTQAKQVERARWLVKVNFLRCSHGNLYLFWLVLSQGLVSQKIQENWRNEGNTSVPQHPKLLEISWAARHHGSLGPEQRRGHIRLVYDLTRCWSPLCWVTKGPRKLLLPPQWVRCLRYNLFRNDATAQLHSATKLLKQFSQQWRIKIPDWE